MIKTLTHYCGASERLHASICLTTDFGWTQIFRSVVEINVPQLELGL